MDVMMDDSELDTVEVLTVSLDVKIIFVLN